MNHRAADEFKNYLQNLYPSRQIALFGGNLTLSAAREDIFACLDEDFPNSHLRVLVHS
jgi:hypothetical protein